MTRTFAVALDLLREARSRRWVLAYGAAVTLFLAVLALGMRMEVVDGALAGWRLFGSVVDPEIRSADVALRPLFEGMSFLVFWGGLAFGIVACADFAPALLAPGRIEHLLSLPVRRAELLAGTFLGVLALVLAAALYGGGGLSLLVWAKTGVLGWGPIAAAALAAAAFSAIYAVMVLAAIAARSAALSAAAGVVVYVAGIVASHRRTLAPLLDAGPARGAFLAATAPVPRLAELAAVGITVAEGRSVDLARLAAHLGAVALFAGAALAAAAVLLDRKDF